MAGEFALVISFVSLFFIGVLFFVFWIIMLVDVAKRKFKDDSEKVIWILVVAILQSLGALVYYFAVYMSNKGKSMKWFWVSVLVLFIIALITGFSFLYSSVI